MRKNYIEDPSVRASSHVYDFGVQLYIYGWNRGKRVIVKSIEYEEVVECAQMEPSFRLEDGQAQALLDDLWRCGLRPNEDGGSVGSFAAQGKHLEDMRVIALGALGKAGVIDNA